MSSGSGLATALAALKAHAAAATIVGALVVGGGTAATVAVTTGAVHVPGVNTHRQSPDTDKGATPRAAACANNGDAERLAAIFYPMFDGNKTKAQTSICTLFVGSNGHALGFGEIQQALETAAAIEKNGGSTTCLTTPDDHGKPSDAGTPASGQASFSAPSANTATTMKIVSQVLADEQHGTPLAQLAKNCGAASATGNPDDHGNGQPDKTPGPKPTHTPGHP